MATQCRLLLACRLSVYISCRNMHKVEINHFFVDSALFVSLFSQFSFISRNIFSFSITLFIFFPWFSYFPHSFSRDDVKKAFLYFLLSIFAVNWDMYTGLSRKKNFLCEFLCFWSIRNDRSGKFIDIYWWHLREKF